MAIRKSSNSGIPFGNTSGRPSNPSSGQPYFNGELQRLELYTGATYGWQNIVAETPGVTGYSGSVIETNTINTITISGTNFASGASASLIGTDGTEYTATSTVVSNLTSITATFGVIPANIEPYDVRVTNPSNLYGVYYDILVVNDKPIWTTSAGSLGTVYTGKSVNTQLVATDEENNNLTYELVSGSLPTGLTLSSSGLISGSPSGSTSQTFNFTISVSDGSNTPQIRVFSMIYTSVAVLSGGTLTSDSTYYYRAFTSGTSNLTISNASISTDILIVGGGGAGGNSYGDQDTGKGGGGAGGILYKSGHSLSPNTYSITIGNGGVGRTRGTNSVPPASNPGEPTTAFGVQANGGGGGGGSDDYANTAPSQGGSGGGAGARNNNSVNSTGASSNQSSYTGWTVYGNSGASSQSGNYGGGGGGGAGGVGSAASGSQNDSIGGNGGPGVDFSSVFGTTFGVAGWFGGGGGGGSYATGSLKAQSSGGQGGGGNGVSAREHSQGGQWLANNINGVANTGGGGGGSSEDAGLRENAGSQSGSGGSGIVIVRYLKSAIGG